MSPRTKQVLIWLVIIGCLTPSWVMAVRQHGWTEFLVTEGLAVAIVLVVLTPVFYLRRRRR